MSTYFRRPNLPALRLDASGENGPVVIFQHGLCGDAAQPAEVFPQDSQFRRITLVMRGHGASEPGDISAFSIATFARDIIALVEERKLAPVVMGGISMGAALSLQVAVRRPDLVRGLILARPAWFTEKAPPNMIPNAEVGALLRRLPGAEAMKIFEASATARRLAEEAPDNLASLRGFFSRQPQDVTAALLAAISADGPGVDIPDLHRISVPTLVIGHGRDAIHPLAFAEELARHIPAAQLVKITPKSEDRQRYVADFRHAMQDFLKELN